MPPKNWFRKWTILTSCPIGVISLLLHSNWTLAIFVSSNGFSRFLADAVSHGKAEILRFAQDDDLPGGQT
jgi:hypothetical protein